MRSNTSPFFLPALLTIWLASSAQAADLGIFNGRVTLPDEPETPSVYFVLRNRTQETRTIVAASCTCAKHVSIRRTAVNEHGQWSSVGMPEGMPIPPGGDVAFAPRGLFLRLTSPRALAAGEQVEIVLEFADGEKVPFQATVEDG